MATTHVYRRNNTTGIVVAIIVVLVLAALAYLAWALISSGSNIVPSYGGTTPAGSTSGSPTGTTGGSNASGGTQSGMQTKTDAASGATFQYPAQLGATYLETTDWPPKVQVLNQAFSCTEGGSATAQAGVTSRQVVNGHVYCVTRVMQGAAGSTYTQYAYAFDKDGKTVILTFSLRAVQCGNYSDPQKTDCLVEQTGFDVNALVDQIAQSLTLTK